MIPANENLDKEAQNRGNFTFGVLKYRQNTSNSYEMQGLTANTTSHFNDDIHMPLQFEDLYNLRNLKPEMRKQLEVLDHGYYLCYKYFVGIMAIIEGVGCIVNLIGLYVPMSQEELAIYTGSTVLLGWNSYQLVLEYRAIDQKNYELSCRAVKLMKWFMIVLGLLFAAGSGKFAFMQSPQLENISTEMYMIMVIVSICLAEGIFYLIYLYGALKVKELLGQIYATLEDVNYFDMTE